MSLYRLLDSPPKEKSEALKSVEVQVSAISKRPYVNLKETRYDNLDFDAKNRKS